MVSIKTYQNTLTINIQILSKHHLWEVLVENEAVRWVNILQPWESDEGITIIISLVWRVGPLVYNVLQ